MAARHDKGGYPRPSTSSSNNNKGPSEEIELEQRAPMMPYTEPPGEKESQPFKMASEQEGSPVGFLAWAGFGCTLFALACMSISFCSPYWMQTYPNSFNTFRNLGLWEVCMDNYMHHADDTQQIYKGCWWVFNTNQMYRKLREWLLPPWLISCQVMATGCLILEISTTLIAAAVFLHFCPLMHHFFHQTYAMFAASAMMFFVTLTTFVAATLFGVLSQDREWMPNPQFNFLSWGYGFFIMSGMGAMGAGVCFYLEAKKAYEQLFQQMDNQMKSELEMLGYPPSDVTGGSYPPPMNMSYPPGYNGHDSYGQYDKGSYEKGYAPSSQGYAPSSHGYAPSSHSEQGYGPQQTYSQSSYGGYPQKA